MADSESKPQPPDDVLVAFMMRDFVDMLRFNRDGKHRQRHLYSNDPCKKEINEARRCQHRYPLSQFNEKCEALAKAYDKCVHDKKLPELEEQRRRALQKQRQDGEQ